MDPANPPPERRTAALKYHEDGRPGKLSVVPTKPFHNQRGLSLAYTPGVAEPWLTRLYPFNRPGSEANVLILRDLNSDNIASKLPRELRGIYAIGPILVGMAAPIHVLQRESTVDDIVHMAVIAAVDAQDSRRSPLPANPLAFTP